MSEAQQTEQNISETDPVPLESCINVPTDLTPGQQTQLNELKESVRTTLTYMNGVVQHTLREKLRDGTIQPDQDTRISNYRALLNEAALRKSDWLSPVMSYTYPGELDVKKSEFNGDWAFKRLTEGTAPLPGFKEFVHQACKSSLESDNTVWFRAMFIYYEYDKMADNFDAAIKYFNVKLEITHRIQKQEVKGHLTTKTADVQMVNVKPTFTVVQYSFNKSVFQKMEPTISEQIRKNAEEAIEE